MVKSMLFLFLMTMSYGATASASYNKLMNLVRLNMSIRQGVPHDLTEYKAKVLLTKDDVFGDSMEILELSDEVYQLREALTEEEKGKLPRNILIATPGSYAMKFYSLTECSKKYFMETCPTEDDLDKKSLEVKFV